MCFMRDISGTVLNGIYGFTLIIVAAKEKLYSIVMIIVKL